MLRAIEECVEEKGGAHFLVDKPVQSKKGIGKPLLGQDEEPSPRLAVLTSVLMRTSKGRQRQFVLTPKP